MSLRAPAWSEAASRNERGSPGSEQRGSSTAHAHGWFGLYECNYGQNQELQFIGEDMPTYIDMSAFPTLVACKANYKVWRSFLVQYLGISEKDAKQMIIAIFQF